MTIFERKNIGLDVHFYNQWEPLYKRKTNWNWIDFNIIKLDFELAEYKENFELNVGLMGFNVSCTLYKPNGKIAKKAAELHEKIMQHRSESKNPGELTE